MPSECTELILLRAADHLYLGVMCHESEPGRLLASQIARDASLRSDDYVEPPAGRHGLRVFVYNSSGYSASSSLSSRAPGEPPPPPAPTGSCQADAETPCLQDSRFEAKVNWWEADGESRAYQNEPGRPALAIGDTQAFSVACVDGARP